MLVGGGMHSPVRAMKAIRVEALGGPEVLRIVDVPSVGAPGPGQVVVRMVTAGVNFLDVGQRSGLYPATLPFTVGVEGAGVVEAVGPSVIDAKPGDRVAFTEVPGAYAEAIVVDADRLIPLPDDFAFEQGAAFPLQGLTAHYLLHDFRRPGPGDVVVVHAAAGGLGALLVQFAKHLGATVIGTVSTEAKARIARDAGADHVILYGERDFAAETMALTHGRGADLILDGVGKSTFRGDVAAAAVRGHIVIFGAASGAADPIVPNELMEKSLTLSGASLRHFIRTRRELLARADAVIAGIRAGWLRLDVARVLPLADAAEAHDLLERRQTTGKLILSIG